VLIEYERGLVSSIKAFSFRVAYYAQLEGEFEV